MCLKLTSGALPESIQKLTNLTELQLSNNALSGMMACGLST
jgi:Leucine-rich repeat (LRR) protein